MYSTDFLGQMTAVGVLGLLAVIFLSSWGKQVQTRKEAERYERIRALEMGVILPPVRLDWPSAAVCIGIGLGVPVGTFLVTWLAVVTAPVPQYVWIAPVLVSFGAIGTAKKLAYRIINPKPSAGVKSKPSRKPDFDPDAFDVVGSRG